MNSWGIACANEHCQGARMQRTRKVCRSRCMGFSGSLVSQTHIHTSTWLFLSVSIVANYSPLLCQKWRLTHWLPCVLVPGPGEVTLEDEGPVLLRFAQDSLPPPRQAWTSLAQTTSDELSVAKLSMDWLLSVIRTEVHCCSATQSSGTDSGMLPSHPLLLLCLHPLCLLAHVRSKQGTR